MSLEEHVNTIRGAMDSLERSVRQCGPLVLGDALATSKLMADAEQLVSHQIVIHGNLPGPAAAELIKQHNKLDELVRIYIEKCRCMTKSEFEASRQ